MEDLDDEDHDHVSYVARGVDVIHCSVLPAIRVLSEELFRAGLVPVLVVDS